MNDTIHWKLIETSAICNNMLITKKDYIYECEDYRPIDTD